MATGAGKSLCYQLPALLTGKMSLVVSPLISLMQDQVLALRTLHVQACFLGSAQEDAAVERDVMAARYTLVYVTPEKLAAAAAAASAAPLLQALKALAAQGRIGLLAVDEAHCVST